MERRRWQPAENEAQPEGTYWNYNKPGDRERALADPMLRHPD